MRKERIGSRDTVWEVGKQRAPCFEPALRDAGRRNTAGLSATYTKRFRRISEHDCVGFHIRADVPSESKSVPLLLCRPDFRDDLQISSLSVPLFLAFPAVASLTSELP